MKKKKFAFILMGADYVPERDRAVFEKPGCDTYAYTVRDFDEACALVVRLKEEGFGAMELCGAFGPERAAKITELTEGKVAVGYVVHDPKLDPLFMEFFGN